MSRKKEKGHLSYFIVCRMAEVISSIFISVQLDQKGKIEYFLPTFFNCILFLLSFSVPSYFLTLSLESIFIVYSFLSPGWISMFDTGHGGIETVLEIFTVTKQHHSMMLMDYI